MTAALVGLGSGALHALSGPDHLVGVAPHAVALRRGAWRVGLAWGIGHGAGTAVISALLLAGVAAVELAVVERWAERGAGVALVAMGLLGLAAVRRTRAGAAAAAPLASPGLRPALGVGLVHGALGAAALVPLVLTAAGPGAQRVAFLAGFAVGGAAAMAALTAALATLARRPALAAVLPRVPRYASVVAIALGGAWLAAA